MPSSSSFWAITSLSSIEKETASPCVPSRSVVSKVWMRIRLALRSGRFLRDAGLLSLFQEWHHFAEFTAHLLDLGIARRVAHMQKLVTAGLVLRNPLARELAGLDLRQNLFHLVTGLLIHDAWPACVIAVLGGIRD